MRLLCSIALAVAVLASGRAAESHSANTALAADLKKLKLAPGLKAEVVAAEPLLQNPVAFSIDARGRYFIAESHRWATSVFDITKETPWLLDDLSFRTVNDRAAFLARQFATNFAVLTNDSELIRLVEDRDGDGIAETSSVFADGFRESTSGTASGVLAQGTNVWFTSIPDLWRFSETVNSRSVISNRSGARPSTSRVVAGRTLNTDSLITDLLITGLGVHISVSGHDVHGLIRGHDGRIYFSFGDRGVCVTNREGVVLNVPDTGGVLRCEPDGRNLEIFCTGLRNPQELAFDDYGNLWTVDNDTAGADPCRVLHLVEGGDYGWRMSYQHMKGFGPWVSEEMWRGGLDGILPPAGTVSQGPAGIAFHPGTGLTPQLAGKFVHADFPGGVWSYSVKPRGASFELAEKEKILWNCWPTDVDFGPDGALYVLDWVESWVRSGKGRIYRVAANGELGVRNTEQVAEVKRLLGEGMAKRGEKELLGLLGHVDRRVRLEAQWELAGRGLAALEGLNEIAEESKSQLQRMHALWAVCQIFRGVPENLSPNEIELSIFSLLHLVEDKDRLVAAHAARALAEAKSYEGKAALAPLLLDSNAAVRQVAGHALAIMPFGRGVRTQPRAIDRLARLINKPWAYRTANQLLPIDSGWRGPLENAVSLLEGKTDDLFLQHIAKLVLQQGVTMGTFYDTLLAQASTNKSASIRETASLAHRRLAERVVSQPVWPGLSHFHASAEAITANVFNFLPDFEPSVVLSAVRAINDAPIPAAYPALAALLDDPRFRDPNWGWAALSNITPAGPFSANVRPPRDQVLLRALNANFRVGASNNAEALVRFAVGAPVSDPARDGSRRGNEAEPSGAATNPPPHVGGYGHLRVEALFLLGAWEVLPAKVGDLPIKPTKDPNHGAVPTVNPENWPGWFDRVVGLYRPLPPRPADDARRALAPHVNALLSDKEPVVALAALDAAVKLRLTNAAPTLVALMRSTNASVALRKQISSALAALGAEELGEVTKLALAEDAPAIRASALPYLNQLGGDEAVLMLGDIVGRAIGVPGSGSDLRLAQAAIVALGKFPPGIADGSLRYSTELMADGKLPATLELEVLEAAAKRSDPIVQSHLARITAERAKDTALGDWRSVLEGGDAERGKAIFFEKVEVQCSRCHAVKGQGGPVGPKLDGIGKARSREYLLEAIVFPNRAIAADFEIVILTLKDGAMHFGVVNGEDDRELRIESPEDGPLRIAKADIVTRQRGLSAMPEGLGQALSRREVRDLVEYLAGLK